MVWLILFPVLVVSMSMKPVFQGVAGTDIPRALGRILMLGMLALGCGVLFAMYLGSRLEQAWASPTSLTLAPLMTTQHAFLRVRTKSKTVCYRRSARIESRERCVPLSSATIEKRPEDGAFLLEWDARFKREELAWVGIMPPGTRRYQFFVEYGGVLYE